MQQEPAQIHQQEEEDQQEHVEPGQLPPEKLKILDNLRKNVIGSHLKTLLRTPFGQKPFVYCDSTASGKALKYIEDYLQTVIMPFYANTHTLQSSAGRKTMACREDARSIIKRVMNCSDQDAVIFVGSGSTSASNLLVNKLKIKQRCDFVKLRSKVEKYLPPESLYDFLADALPPELDAKQNCQRLAWNDFKCILCGEQFSGLQLYIQHAQSDEHKNEVKKDFRSSQAETTPIVFVSVFEHNSNVLPWKEAGARVEIMPMTNEGDMDYDYIEKRFKEVKDQKCLKVGAFSAGSNITGTLYDVDRLAEICHKHDALACFDYAAVSPYVNINMSGPSPHRRWDHIVDDDLCWKDAIIVSPHKLVGGPQTSGLLVAKRDVLFDTAPHRVGGGPILFVNEKKWEYVENPEELEEAGTPAILQDIRTGIVFELKDQIGEETIHMREDLIMKKVLPRLLKIPNLVLMGNNHLPKVPIFAFVVRTFNGKILHPNFVTQLLGDLFGIQTRSGCSCAGMYGLKLLGVDDQLADIYLGAIYQGLEIVKMGYSRLNFSYFFNDEDVDYICHALEFVAKFGWMFLPNYEFEMKRGLWISKDETRFETNTRIGDIDFTQDHLGIPKTNNLHLKTIHTFQEVNPLYFYIEKAYIHLMDIVEKFQYQNHHSFRIEDHCQSCEMPPAWRGYIWWLFPVQALEPLLTLKSNSIEACEQLNDQLRAQTTPFQLPFDISDLTRNPNMYNRGKHVFMPPYADGNVPETETSALKEHLAGIADPNREFRRHLVNMTEEEQEDEMFSMSARQQRIYQERQSSIKKPSGMNLTFEQRTTSNRNNVILPKEDKTELLREVPEAPSDMPSEHPVSDEEEMKSVSNRSQQEDTQETDKDQERLIIDVGELNSSSASVSQTTRRQTKEPEAHERNGAVKGGAGYAKMGMPSENGQDFKLPTSIQMTSDYNMQEEYMKKKNSITPVGKGSKNLSNLISKQLAYVKKDTAEYDDQTSRQKYGKKVLDTSPERTKKNPIPVSGKKSPSPRDMGQNGTMFTTMRKSTYKRRPL